METTECTFQLLEQLQQTLFGMRDETRAGFVGVDKRLDDVDERLSSLEHHVSSTNDRLSSLERNGAASHEILGIVNHRLGFFERSATAAMEGRARLEDHLIQTNERVDRVEARLTAREALERA